MADRVVPNSLNYTDIKPESIESEIKLVRFQPTATITGAKGGDMVKFLLSGNGFYDPYSAYFQFEVEVKDDQLIDDEIKFLDRSAHSFISRLVIRSQGVELERIENYDMIAAMINDMIYSPEQNSIHQWEGFPTHLVPYKEQRTGEGSIITASATPIAIPAINQPEDAAHFPSRGQLGQLLNQGATPLIHRYVGEPAFMANRADAPQVRSGPYEARSIDGTNPAAAVAAGIDAVGLDTFYDTDSSLTTYNGAGDYPANSLLNGTRPPLDYAFHEGGFRKTTFDPTVNPNWNVLGTKKYTFIIPIYSGVMGLLMPDKKLLPLNLLPLDIELTFNQHALYSNLAAGSRSYTITKFNMFAHMIFFEQDIHRSLEAAVAEHGIFIYCNSFHSAPQQLIATKVIPSVAYISMNLKSINSVHMIFTYNIFETNPAARKLHFVSHNLTSLQLLNGTQLIPQYAVEGTAGTSRDNGHVPFIVELFKAWNKMHDPKTDGAIQAYNFCGDVQGGQSDPTGAIPWATNHIPVMDRAFLKIVNKQANVGRTQYGISLEGEELGSDKTMITGRKSQYPFLLQMNSTVGKVLNRTSYMFTFLRADFIVYIRPDLQIVTLGK